jgi:NAD(P)-dependent dehydrogenase (short-subunit alcohol dehydrogenase family)
MLACLSLAALSPLAATAQADQPEQKAVLITGASTGLGREMAELFASRGVFVYAGARKQQDIDALNALENIQAVKLDVTDKEQIDAAVKTVTEAGRGLHGLINNAGVAVIYPLTSTPEAEMQFQMDVNLFGPYRVTQAFAPLIIESKGRINTIGSISGILSGPMFGPYSMSKHAMEAFTDSLARELEEQGVQVSIIEPGNYESKIGDNLLARMKSLGYEDPESPYHYIHTRMVERMADRQPNGDPAEVAEAAWLAMFEDQPKRRYLVVPNQRQADITIAKAVEELVQLNQRHKYSFSRDELVQMLDKAMQEHP